MKNTKKYGHKCACGILNILLKGNCLTPENVHMETLGLWEGIRAGTLRLCNDLKEMIDFSTGKNFEIKCTIDSFTGGSEDCTRSLVWHLTELREEFPEASDKLDEVAKKIASDLIDLMKMYCNQVNYSEIFSFLGEVGVPESKLYGEYQPKSYEFLVSKFCGSSAPAELILRKLNSVKKRERGSARIK